MFAIAVVAIGAVWWIASGAFTNFTKANFSKPKAYFSYVEKKQLLGGNYGSAGAVLDNVKNKLDFSDMAVEEEIKVTIGERGERYLKLAKEQGVNLSWLQSAALSYALNQKDGNIAVNASVALNDQTLLSPAFLLDTKKKTGYVTAPGVTKEYLKVDLEQFWDDSFEADAFSDIREALPDQKTFQSMMERYLKLIFEQIDEDKFEKTKRVELSTDEVTEKYTQLKVTLKEKDLKKIFKAVCKELSDDKDVRKLVEALAESADYEDMYEEFQRELDDVRESIDDEELGIDKLTIELYLDGKSNVVGRIYEITPAYGEKATIKAVFPTKGNKTGLEISYKQGSNKAVFAGTGKRTGGKLSGEFTCKVDGEKVLTMDVDSFDVNGLKKGKIKGHVTITSGASAELGNLLYYLLGPSYRYSDLRSAVNALGSSVRFGLDLVLDCNASKHSIDIGVMDGDEDIFRIAFKGKEAKSSKITIPSKALDVQDQDDLRDFIDSLNWDGVVDALEKADLPGSYVNAAEYGLESLSGVLDYTDRSRYAKDEQFLSSFYTAAVSSYATEAGGLDEYGTYVITITSSEITVTGGQGERRLLGTFTSLTATDPSEGFAFSDKFYSDAGRDIDHVEITIDSYSGSVRLETFMKHPDRYGFDVMERR